ncbi:aspartate/glutamate racemase family protein [Paracoccus sp. Z330]|uniref:Aspartate/glutamate racemase family protein n=1 Tax=Paracoccus onchidii TaxID=3017813 RepID=A0ABT4ZEQ4_9RHOB|nr:aspartate/glutamate racemase family protein [Paracoccus onchidii]MDB6177747.1 aspartate/glutamate racemase family protein [Paracoccus onchidii]
MLRAASHRPGIGIGQATMSLAALHNDRFGIVTTLDPPVPLIAANVTACGHQQACVGIVAAGVPMLKVKDDEQDVEDRLAMIIAGLEAAGAGAIILGCAGISGFCQGLSRRTAAALIDGVMAVALVAQTFAGPSSSDCVANPDKKSSREMVTRFWTRCQAVAIGEETP